MVEPVVGACLHGHPSVTEEFGKRDHVAIGTVISSQVVPASNGYLDGHNRAALGSSSGNRYSKQEEIQHER